MPSSSSSRISYSFDNVQLPESLLFRTTADGERQLTDTARLMVDTAVAVGIRVLGKKNAGTFLRRALYLAIINGKGPKPFSDKQKLESTFLTWKQVRSFVGMTVETRRLTEKQFARHAMGLLTTRVTSLANKAMHNAGRVCAVRLTRLVQAKELPEHDRDFFTRGGRYKRDYHVFKIGMSDSEFVDDPVRDAETVIEKFWLTAGKKLQHRELFEATVDYMVDVNPYCYEETVQ